MFIRHMRVLTPHFCPYYSLSIMSNDTKCALDNDYTTEFNIKSNQLNFHAYHYCTVSVKYHCKASLDKKELAGTIHLNLSNIFDWIDHDHLIAKLTPYVLDWDALKYTH